jgi:serpin B
MTKKFLISAAIILFLLASATEAFFIFNKQETPVPEPLPEVPSPAAPGNEPENEPGNSSIPAVLNEEGATPAGIKNAADANNQFATALYSKIKDEGNVFFSPYSISSAFGMVYEGAAGKTAEEIRAAFGFPNDSGERRASFASIFNRLNDKNAKYDLRSANALWAQKDYVFLNSYIDVLKNFYGAEANNVDFKESAENVRQEINSWVESKTNNKIKDLFAEGSLNAMTRLVLTNAVYFKGLWESPFEKANTSQQDFYLDSGSKVSVSTMNKKEDFSYAESGGVKVLEMPYQGEKLSMVIFLPAKGSTISFEESLSLEKITELRNKLTGADVVVSIPKFKFDESYSLNDSLKKLGVSEAFVPGGADFSGMDGTKNLFIDLVVHKAFIEVNEEGTEAAAATGVTMSATAMPVETEPFTFKADHPFIFLIQDNESGNILFMGKVANPNS